jgi:two-component system, LuxR family, response regulator FixJ
MSVPGTVYVVDDDDAVRDSVSLLLQIHGVLALTYASGDAFLRDVSPDKNACLRIDMNMPGMTGLEVLAELQRRGIAIPAIVMTGVLAASMQAAAARTGATVLRKPFRSGELLAYIKEALGRYQD